MTFTLTDLVQHYSFDQMEIKQNEENSDLFEFNEPIRLVMPMLKFFYRKTMEDLTTLRTVPMNNDEKITKQLSYCFRELRTKMSDCIKEYVDVKKLKSYRRRGNDEYFHIDTHFRRIKNRIPNNDTFTDNYQFIISIPESKLCVIQEKVSPNERFKANLSFFFKGFFYSRSMEEIFLFYDFDDCVNIEKSHAHTNF